MTPQNGTYGASLPLLLVRRSEIPLELNQTWSAAADVDRPVSLLRKMLENGAHSSHLGRAYLAQGRVLLREHKPVETQRAFSLAAEHLEDSLGPAHSESRKARALAEALRRSH